MKKIHSVAELKKWKAQLLSGRKKSDKIITVCGGTGCQAYGCQEVKKAFQRELQKQSFKTPPILKYTGCPGFCERGPLVTIQPGNIFYQKVNPEDVPVIVSETVKRGKILDRLL
ncbi:MAG: (2Fe-2S) ferredoxin domain-containing protein, partial [Deltaproteobacteria bacterium]|nr:(2Fe-2S) ferredoxin domain-containing protein [Deltaproteobacteria bacterium]